MMDEAKGTWTMLRIQALRLFRREFFHALRNNIKPEAAVDQAVSRVKKLVQEDLRTLYPGNDPASEIERMEQWGDILVSLIEFQLMLKDIPVDQSRLDEIPTKEQAT